MATKSELNSNLDSNDAVTRHRALLDLVHEHGMGDCHKFWEMLDNEDDGDIVLLLASHLSRCRQATCDKQAFDRIRRALFHFDVDKASKSVIEDAYLRMFENMSSREIVLMKRHRRDEILRNSSFEIFPSSLPSKL